MSCDRCLVWLVAYALHLGMFNLVTLVPDCGSALLAYFAEATLAIPCLWLEMTTLMRCATGKSTMAGA